MKKILKWIFALISIAMIGYILLVSSLIWGPSLKSYTQRTTFDSNQWKSHLESHNNIKQRMVNDLLLHYSLVGMSVEEVTQLLGKPPQTNYFKDCNYVYWLGPESGLGVDSEWLCIKFENNRVTEAVVRRD